MRRNEQKEEHGMLDRTSKVPGWVIEMRMSLKELKEDKDNLVDIINPTKPMLLITDTATDDMDEQDEFADIALQLLNMQKQEEKHAAVIYGSLQGKDPFRSRLD